MATTSRREDLAWAAGFVDGEGCIQRAERKRVNKRLTFQVAQQSREPLDRLQRVLGGKVYGPYGPYGKTRPYHLWYLDGFERVQAAVAMIWPFLSQPKRTQARNALLDARYVGRF